MTTTPPDNGATFDLSPALMSANATCEGCNAPATTCDSRNTPLCDACYGALPVVDSEMGGGS